MISTIAYFIVKALVDELSYIDKWAGLVQPLQKSVAGKIKIFPASINNPSECCTDDYFDLVPDSKKITVAYMEKIGNDNILLQRSNYDYVESKLRFVMWYNLNKLNEGKYVDEGIIINSVKTALPRSLPDSDFIDNRRVRIFINDVVSGSSLFDRYTYQEVKNQFLMFPYGAFGIDLTVNYINLNCSGELSPIEGCGAGMGNHACSPDPCTDFQPSKPNIKTINGISPDSYGNVLLNLSNNFGNGVRITGTDSGTFGDISITDDYVYVCVQTGTNLTAIWKKIVAFQSI